MGSLMAAVSHLLRGDSTVSKPLSPGSSGTREQFDIFLNFGKANIKKETSYNLSNLFSYLEKAKKELLQPNLIFFL